MGIRNTPLALTLSVTALLGGCLSIEQPLGEDTGTGGNGGEIMASGGSGISGGFSGGTGGMMIDPCADGIDPDGTGGIDCGTPASGGGIMGCGGYNDPDGTGGVPPVDDCGFLIGTGGIMVDPCANGMDPDGTGGIDCGTVAYGGGAMGCGGYYDPDGTGGMPPVDDCGIPIGTGGMMIDPCADGMDPDGTGGIDCGTPGSGGGTMGCGGYYDPDGTGGVPAIDDCGIPIGTGGDSADCGCMPTSELCMRVTCGPAGECLYESTSTGADADGDGFGAGCDCDDSDANVFPGQTAFFDAPVPSIVIDPNDPGVMMAGTDFAYDYDCDGYGEPRLKAVADVCRVLSGTTACTGDGWVDEGTGVPACGEGGLYRACQYQNGSCVADEVMSVQRCR